MHRPLGHRYLVGFVIAATILVAVGIATVATVLRSGKDSQLVSQTHEIITHIEHAHAMLLDGLAAQRNYLLTGNLEYKTQFTAMRPQLERQLDTLLRLMRQDSAQLDDAQQLAALMDTRYDTAEGTLQIYEKNGLAAAQSNLGSNNSLAQSKRIAELSLQIERNERDALSQRRAASARSARILFILGALGVPVSLGILIWVYVLLAREVRDRQQAVRHSSTMNTRLTLAVDNLERISGELRELSRYGSLLQSCRDTEEALSIARRTFLALMPGASGTIYLLRESKNHAEAETGWGTQASQTGTFIQPQDCWALRRGQPHLLEDIHTGLACPHLASPAAAGAEESNACSCLCLPLDAQGVSLGMVHLSASPDALLPHVQTATTAAEYLSLALANLRLQQTLRHQSIRDPLTGLYNRRYLEESLQRELARSERLGHSIALLMLDLDHFKALNDHYGHDGGDAVLSAFGRLLEASCRKEDIACRYGGEEFTLILPEITEDTARERAEQIRSAVSGLRIQHLQGEIQKITVSIGLALAPQHAGTPSLLLHRADEALYRAKRAGRDRIEVASDA